MKERIKRLLLIGFAIAVITSVVTILITLVRSQSFNLIHLSNILFVEFLIFLSLSIMILFKQQFLFKSKNKRREKNNNEDRLNSSLEFLLLAGPLLIISVLLLLFN